MSDLGDRLNESLPRLVAGIEPDPHDLLVVRRRGTAARQRRRRAALVAAAVAAVVVTFTVLGLDLDGRLRSVEPVGPAPSPSSSPGGVTRELEDPFTVLHTVDTKAAGIERPLKVAAAADGNVYVTDRAQRITEVTVGGDVVRQWGGSGTRPGKFRLYSGAVAVGPDGNVYVADTGNFRIQVFTSDGRFVAEYGGYGQGPGKFVWPTDIVVGPDGTMYVADDRAATITALSPTGQQLWRGGPPAEADPDPV